MPLLPTRQNTGQSFGLLNVIGSVVAMRVLASVVVIVLAMSVMTMSVAVNMKMRPCLMPHRLRAIRVSVRMPETQPLAA